jgi:hypothetical protein
MEEVKTHDSRAEHRRLVSCSEKLPGFGGILPQSRMNFCSQALFCSLLRLIRPRCPNNGRPPARFDKKDVFYHIYIMRFFKMFLKIPYKERLSQN